MKLDQFIKTMLSAELANSGMAYQETSSRSLITGERIRPDSIGLSADVVSIFVILLNDGIQEIYSLFPFLRKKVYVRELEGVSSYKLTPQFSRDKDCVEIPAYIMDSKTNPFGNDLIKVLSISYADGAPQFNVVYSSSTAIINNITSIYDPYPVEGRVLDITYQAHPALLKNIDIYKTEEEQQKLLPEILDQFIDVPSPILKVLRAYVAFKFYMQTPVLLNSGAASEMYNTYTATLKQVQDENLKNNSLMYPNTLLEQKGFI